jgi:maltose alpha-D-glucosyltransferase/alpha-amylase
MSKPAESPLPSDPLWFKDAVIYEIHVRAFQDSDGDGMGDFKGLTQRLSYLADLGVTALWVLPFCPSPWKDDGYDISDYNNIHPAYGTLRDFQAFLAEAHRRGIRIISELVLNHTSDQHVWFQRSRRAPAGSKWREFYVWSDTPEKYQDARIIFKDFEASNWTWDPVAKSYFWHRFYSHQPDLNFDNPEVRQAMVDAVDFWFDMGVDGLRLDAVPYLYERQGTDCENLPETHAFLRELRAHIDSKYAGRMLLAEANQWPEDAVAYFGQGDECQMAFHFPVMPRLFMSTRMGDRYPITDILQITPKIPESCQWALFLRNHDELTLEMVTDEERDYMYRVYAHDRDMRINLGIRRRLSPLLENDRRRIELMNGLLFSLPGTPVLYYGDEIGMGDNFYLGDRNGVRTPMQWSRDRNAGFSSSNPQRLYLPVVIDPEYHYEAINVENQQSNPHSLLWWMKRLINQRKQSKAFGRGTLEFLYPENRRILAFVRSFGDEHILVVANLSRVAQGCTLALPEFKNMVPIEMFGNTEFPAICDDPYFLSLGPHAFYWFLLQPQRASHDLLRSPQDISSIPTFEVISFEAALTGESRHQIERYLPGLVRTLKWFQGKERQLASVSMYDAIPFAEAASWLALLRFEFSAGDAEIYSVSLSIDEGARAEEVLRDAPQSVLGHVRAADGRTGILYGGSHNPRFREQLLSAISRRRRFQGENGVLAGAHTTAFRKIWEHDPNLDSALCKADQNGTSMQFGERFMLKVFRRIEAGKHPELEVGKYLAGRPGGFQTARLAGWLEYRDRNGDVLIAGVMHEYLAHETSAWQFTVDSVNSFFETALASGSRGIEEADSQESIAALAFVLLASKKMPEAAETQMGPYLNLIGLLGRRTAELHIALAQSEDPDFAPEPLNEFYRLGLYHSLLGTKNRVLQQLTKAMPGMSSETQEDCGKLLAAEPEITAKLQLLRDLGAGGKRIRIHGDFNLRQVLFTGKDFYLIDFEGEVERSLGERRIKRSPLRDVAGLVLSLYSAAHNSLYGRVPGTAYADVEARVLRPIAATWYRWAAAEFLRGYLAVKGIADLLPVAQSDVVGLLDVLMLEQALREIARDAADRPEHIHVSIRAVLHLLNAEDKA